MAHLIPLMIALLGLIQGNQNGLLSQVTCYQSYSVDHLSIPLKLLQFTEIDFPASILTANGSVVVINNVTLCSLWLLDHRFWL